MGEEPRSPLGATRTVGPWTKNLVFRKPSGFWGDAEWYDLQLERRLPEVRPMLEELVYALPPLGAGAVCDVCAGSGRAAAAIRAAYPRARLTLLDVDAARLEIAAGRVAEPATFTRAALSPEAPTLPDAPYDAVTLVLALRHVVAPAPHYAEAHGLPEAPSSEASIAESYGLFFSQVFCSLQPGGHCIVGDHVDHGHPSVYAHCKLMERAGFVDVDVSWRSRDFFVLGGRVPVDDDEPPWMRRQDPHWRGGDHDRGSEDGIEMRASIEEDQEPESDGVIIDTPETELQTIQQELQDLTPRDDGDAS